MNILFAHWEAFWLRAREQWLLDLYHPHFPDDNERMESYWPCSDNPQFWPHMIVKD